DYIRNQTTVGGLTNWTVCLINYEATGRKPFPIASIDAVGAGLTRANPQITDGEATCDIHTLLSKDQEYLDYDQKQFEKVKQMQEDGDSAEKIRKNTRSREHG